MTFKQSVDGLKRPSPDPNVNLNLNLNPNPKLNLNLKLDLNSKLNLNLNLNEAPCEWAEEVWMQPTVEGIIGRWYMGMLCTCQREAMCLEPVATHY